MTLNPEQQEAVRHKAGPLLVLAGAGSGKTRVVTERCAALIHSGIDPSHILGLTFTNQAAGEMRERLIAQGLPLPLLTTFHSFGARTLREACSYLGFDRHFVIYDEEDSLKVIRSVIEELHIKEEKGTLREIKNLISSKKNRLEFNQRDHDPVFDLYQAKLKAFQAVDFDDLLYLTVALFQNHPEVLERHQQRYPYIMVDEYQDTNAAQYEILSLLAAKSGNLFVVGDPDQSIYSWRGANISNILNFEKDYPGAKVIRLEQNYRSSEIILQAASHVIEHNTRRYKKRLWSERKEGEKVAVAELMNERLEARFVALQIEALYAKGVPYSEMVVFYRTNAQSRPFEDFFISWGIPYRLVGGLSFYQRREIKDILGYLRAVLNPMDYVSVVRTINLPKRGIGETTLERLSEGARLANISLLDYLKTPSLKFTKGVKKGVEEYLKLMERLHESAASLPLSDLVKLTIEESRYLEYLQEDPRSFNERVANLDELIAKAKEFENTHPKAPLAAFLEELTLKSSPEDETTSPHTVSLMTLHNGKGLEFQAVFMVGMEEGLFPHVNSLEQEALLEEERRLCYVGMTRAKEFLTLSGCTIRYIWGAERVTTPSRFIDEIPVEYVTRLKESFL